MNHTSNNIALDILRLICSMAIGYVIGMLAIVALVACHLLDATGESRQFLLLSQAILTTGIFIIGPVGYWCFVKKKSIWSFFAGEQRYLQFTLLTVALMLVTLFVNTYFVYWNLQLQFPAWLSKVGDWVKAKEESLKHLTHLLSTFSSWQDLGTGIIVMSLIPAIGEELVFRGIVQSLLRQRCNSHVAIWVTAFIFSAIHLQFYGFLPRFLLGALFGYLYTWTQHLIYPIIAHCLNNSFTLILLFMNQHTSYTFSEEHHLLPLPIFMVCLLLMLAISVFIYQQTKYLRHQ